MATGAGPLSLLMVLILISGQGWSWSRLPLRLNCLLHRDLGRYRPLFFDWCRRFDAGTVRCSAVPVPKPVPELNSRGMDWLRILRTSLPKASRFSRREGWDVTSLDLEYIRIGTQ